MSNIYTTIASHSEGIYKDKGSKFLAFAEPVMTESEVRERLDWYRREYRDARHVCYAYMLGEDGQNWRVSDDGEPSGTAGRPILGQIKSKGLTNILVVVVRYFGGILLGTGGLIVAYKSATQVALENAEIIQKDVLIRRELSFPYAELSNIMSKLRKLDAQIVKQQFDNDCYIECYIKKEYERRI